MRNLLVLTGIQGSGKSSWVKQNNLEEFTLSLDTIRVPSVGESYSANGDPIYKSSLSPFQLNFFKESLKSRLSLGLFTVIDNMNVNSRDFTSIIKEAKGHGYSLYYKKFISTPTLSLSRINSRKTNKIPLDSIEKSKEKFDNLVIPPAFKEINKLSDIKDFKNYSSTYSYDHTNGEIFVIGDIHGCSKELQSFLDKNYNTSDTFIFCGDYIDRGYDNTGVLNTLRGLKRTNGNIILLEGNHERWLRYWGNSREDLIKSKEFNKYTLPDLLKDPLFQKRKARDFCKHLIPFSDLTINGKRALITHGGVNSIKGTSTSYPFRSSDSYIKGSGKYSDLLTMYEQGSKDYDVIVHGHRNLSGIKNYTHKDPTTNKETVYYNLEGGIDSGGELRYIKLGKTITEGSIKSSYNYGTDMPRLIDSLNNSSLIRVSPTLDPDIKAYNFTKEAFFGKKWTREVIKARGLFINTSTQKIVGRGYEKFFNYKENEFTGEEAIKNLKYPLRAYKKDNGFLGIIYTTDGKSLSFNTKSGDMTDYAKTFKDIFWGFTFPKDREQLAHLLNMLQSSLVCEVIDMTTDPHLTNYGDYTKRLILLDLIRNTPEFKKFSYKSFKGYTQFLRFNHNNPKKRTKYIKRKSLVSKINSFEELEEFFNSNNHVDHEGFVIEDSNGFMFKKKMTKYIIKKALRSFCDTKNRTSVFKTLTTHHILGNHINKETLIFLMDYLERKSFKMNLTYIDYVLNLPKNYALDKK